MWRDYKIDVEVFFDTAVGRVEVEKMLGDQVRGIAVQRVVPVRGGVTAYCRLRVEGITVDSAKLDTLHRLAGYTIRECDVRVC